MDLTLNRRQDFRLSASFVNVKIRKRNIGFRRWSDDCTLLDISPNGLSLTSESLNLKTLQKVEFELDLEERKIFGIAIVCYSGHVNHQKKYGLLFIQTNPEFDEIFAGKMLSVQEVKSLGEEVADNFMFQRNVGTNDSELNNQNQLMIDAVKSMAARLGGMGMKIRDESGGILNPDVSLQILSNGQLSFPVLSSDSNEILRSVITTTWKRGEIQAHYRLTSGKVFESLVDLLEYVCASFGNLSALR